MRSGSRYPKAMLVRRAVVISVLAAAVLAQQANPPAPAKPKAAAPAAKSKAKINPLAPDETAARALLNSMSLRDRVAQLVIGVSNGDVYSTDSDEYRRFRHWVVDLRIGGIIVNNAVEFGAVRNANPYAMAVFLNQMQRLARVPLLVASDFERGASMRVTGGTAFPHNMAFGAAGDIEETRFEGLTAAREARALGVHWIFAPVADVNNNPANPVINLRSYGEDPEQVARHVAAFIEGAHAEPSNRVLVSAKHFPGHGDTAVDSHLGLPVLTVGRERLDSLELIPFRKAIASGVDSIMTAHISLPELDASGVPATVSPKVLTSLLRDDLKFQNLIVTDAMSNMVGFTSMFDSGEGSVRALLAGADVLLMPADPDKAINAVVAAVQRGRLTRQRIDQSAMRVLRAKTRLGLPAKKLVDLNAIADALQSDTAAARAQHVADRAVTLLRNEGNVLPLARSSKACLLVINSLRISQQGQRTMQEFRSRAPDGRVLVVDTTLPLPALEAVMNEGNGCSTVVVANFAAITSNLRDVAPFLEEITNGVRPVVLVSFNDPYAGAAYPKAAAYLTTFSSAPPSEVAAVKALFGEIPVSGRSPVTIPQLAAVGDGLQTAARAGR
jgi:beta-N-acetylhexosaminidase